MARRRRPSRRALPREDAPSLVSGESRGYAYDPAQNLARRTNNAAGSTVSATVNALNQLTSGLGFSSYTYDRRGNLTFADAGSWAHAFTYDHENQCVSAGGYYGPAKSEFVYDGKGRLRVRKDWSWTGSGWYPNGEVRYLYDGMLLIQERTSAGHPAVTYTRGMDLSGSLADAGGIGGLLARTAHQSTSPYQPSTHAYYHADGNGNVTYLLRQDRTPGASYRYDPYGRLIASSGPLSSANLMRFSSKPWHDHSETYYYGYRFYLPEAQRWLNRDPIEEQGGINLYRYVSNDPINWLDPDGLKDYCCKDFESQWKMPPQGRILRRVPLIGRTAACDAAKIACLARCGEKYGSGNLEMMEGDNKECQDKCNADCYDNWLKCTGKIVKIPKPPRSPGDKPSKEQ